MITNSTKISKFIDKYIDTLDAAQKAKLKVFEYDSWSFSDEKEFSERLINLVLSGKKIATAGLFLDNEKIPNVESLGVILDHEGNPRCLIEYTEVTKNPDTRLFME